MMVQKSLLLLFLIFLLGSCDLFKGKKTAGDGVERVEFDLDAIKKRGHIKVVTDYNSTNYFVYKGRPMGYQLEMLQSLCHYLDVKLEIHVSNDVAKNIESLNVGEVDLIATNLAVTRERQENVSFTEPHSMSRQVLVQLKPQGRNSNALIRNQLELAGRTIYVQQKSAFVDRLRNLSDEIGDSIHVVEIPDYEVEQLIGLVASGEIPYTVCDEDMARVNLNYYTNIDIETAVSFPQKISWAVRKNSPDILDAINSWMTSFKKSARYHRIYNKYFRNKRSIHIVDAGFHSIKGGMISDYDELIKAECQLIEWDWRLLASLIFQESRFIANIESWAGARGLMQLMPETAATFGVVDIESPIENIKGGVKFIKWLDKRLSPRIEDEDERLKFILASYNVGLGHVLDAMNLAAKNGKDPKVWYDNVDYYLLNKSNPEFYNDPIVKFGYCRGEEPYRYVIEILERFEHYKNVMK